MEPGKSEWNRDRMAENRKRIRIATAGDNCMDIYDEAGKAFPGGNPVNVAVYAARLGAETAYVGPVGTDDYGKQMIAAIRGKGVDVSHMKILPGATAVTHVKLADGDRILGEYEEGVMADFRLDDADIEFLAGYDMVVTGLWGTIEDELFRLRERGVLVAYDFATRPYDPAAVKAIAHVDYGFFADDEKTDEELQGELTALQEKGPKVMVVTRGGKGSMAYDGARFYYGGIVPCEVVDTMGAGDSFIAGFLYAVCEGKGIAEAMAAGAANSSVTIGYVGAW